MSSMAIAPSDKFIAVTKSDSVPVTYSVLNEDSGVQQTLTQFRGLFVGVAGNVVVKNSLGTSVTFACYAGQVLPVCGSFVMAATSATGIVAIF